MKKVKMGDNWNHILMDIPHGAFLILNRLEKGTNPQAKQVGREDGQKDAYSNNRRCLP